MPEFLQLQSDCRTDSRGCVTLNLICERVNVEAMKLKSQLANAVMDKHCETGRYCDGASLVGYASSRLQLLLVSRVFRFIVPSSKINQLPLQH